MIQVNIFLSSFNTVCICLELKCFSRTKQCISHKLCWFQHYTSAALCVSNEMCEIRAKNKDFLSASFLVSLIASFFSPTRLQRAQTKSLWKAVRLQGVIFLLNSDPEPAAAGWQADTERRPQSCSLTGGRRQGNRAVRPSVHLSIQFLFHLYFHSSNFLSICFSSIFHSIFRLLSSYWFLFLPPWYVLVATFLPGCFQTEFKFKLKRLSLKHWTPLTFCPSSDWWQLTLSVRLSPTTLWMKCCFF